MKTSSVKERIRSEFLKRRRGLSQDEVRAASRLVENRFVASSFFRASTRLALYASFAGEVLTDEIFTHAVEAGKEVSYPRLIEDDDGRLAFFRTRSLTELAESSFRIREPVDSETRVEPDEFDLVVVPGVAFDTAGARLGFGKGHYDMALAGITCPVVALAYDFQVFEGRIPVEPHDVRVDAIVTESGIIDVRREP